MKNHTVLGSMPTETFMRKYWQKKPLLIRQAIPDMLPILSREALFELAAQDDVESRLISQTSSRWRMQHGPIVNLPSIRKKQWTLLVQGVDLHDDRAADLLRQFRFIPDARLDDLMISYASDQGGVGAHFDSYDVFLLQAHGQRRWRIGAQQDLSLKVGLPLKVLENFTPEQEFVLDPGDMLYLPPHYAHEGVAVGECMTYSIGFRVPRSAELASELLMGLSEEVAEDSGGSLDVLYQDPLQPAVFQDASVPQALQQFAANAIAKALKDPQLLNCLLGESLTEPKPNVWFDNPDQDELPNFVWPADVRLDRRTKMLFDDKHVFINGESFRAAGQDAKLLRKLANDKFLPLKESAKLSANAAELMQAWWEEGWWHE